MVKNAQRSLTRTKVIFILTTIFLVGLFYFTYSKITQLVESSAWVDHTNKVTVCLEKIKSSALSAEASQKNYLLTGESFVFAKREIALKELDENLAMADSLTVDNDLQAQNLKVLHTLIDERVTRMNEVLKLNASEKLPGNLKINVIEGIHIAEALEKQLNKMVITEKKLLETRSEDYSRLSSLTPMIIVSLFFVGMVILFIAYSRITNALQYSLGLQLNLNEANIALGKKNKELEETGESYLKMFDNNPVAMSFGEIGTNKILYTNNAFTHVFGYNKDETVGKTSEELNLVSKEENDRLIPIIMGMLQETRSIEELQALPPEETAELLEKLKEKMFSNGFEVVYTKKNGETFYAVVYYEIIEIRGKKYTLTSYQDITERKKAEKKLEENNERLGMVNRELESFNYIASHDLKEPLRKIQTFSSRIVDEEVKNLSEKGRQYFERMQSAAKRMEVLIEDLLAYSRTSTSEKKFEKVDLREVIEEVKGDFCEVIEEKKATVEIGEMPRLNIIRFQFHQLMSNLIGNSLKFSVPGRSPKVTITSKIEHGSHTNMPGLLPEQNYCHITVTDNGIGFEPEYQERIFDIFQQLNPKEKYGGTGIGLAIVKKIVENHNGAISASSELDKGARFDIYLPV